MSDIYEIVDGEGRFWDSFEEYGTLEDAIKWAKGAYQYHDEELWLVSPDGEEYPIGRRNLENT